MSHKAIIVPGSLKRNAVSGGIEFVIECCGEFPSSVHIQDLAAFADDEERLRVIADYLHDHEQRHESELAAQRFLEAFTNGGSDCGCN